MVKKLERIYYVEVLEAEQGFFHCFDILVESNKLQELIDKPVFHFIRVFIDWSLLLERLIFKLKLLLDAR